MKLLILGAGGHGKVVKEVAEAMYDGIGKPIYEKIDFLDDYAPEAVGKIKEIEKWCFYYDEIFVGIGNNNVRKQLLENLAALKCNIPVLVHPTAYISKSAVVKAGTIIEPMAIVNANTIVEDGGIISVGAIVDHDVIVGTCAHVNAGAICKAGSRIEPTRKLEAGEVVIGYKNTNI